jgi:hypothetical protein
MADLQNGMPTTAEVDGADGLPDDPFLETAHAPDEETLARAHSLLAGHPVADGYSGLPWALRHLPWYDLELGEMAVDTDVPRMREGRVGALFWSLHLPEGLTGDRAVGATLEQLDLVHSVIDAHPEGLRPARTAGQIIDAHHCGRVAVVLGPAGAPALGDSLGILRILHTLGLRLLTLTGTTWASEAGLTRFGEEVIREMNRLGVLADLSGASRCARTRPTCPTTCSPSWARRAACAWCR